MPIQITPFDLKTVKEKGKSSIEKIKKLLQSFGGSIPLGKPDTEEDTQQVIHIKEGYEDHIMGFIRSLQEMLNMQNEILQRCEVLEKGNLALEKQEQIKNEIRALTKKNLETALSIKSAFEGYDKEAKVLTEQQKVKQQIHKLLAKEELKEENLDIIAKNQNIVKPKLLGTKIIFKFGPLILRFRIINENKEKGTIDLAHLIDKEREDTQTLTHYKDIPIAMRKQELQRRIHLLRVKITEWAYQNKEDISKIGEEGFRARLSAFGVFTKEEIDGLIKAVMEKGSPIINKLMDEYKNKLEKMKEQLTPPQDFQAKFRFDAEMQKLVNAIDKDKIAISPKDKIEYLARVEQEIIAPMINYWKSVWKVDTAIWTANLQRIINGRKNYYASLEKPQATPQRVQLRSV